MAEQEKKPERNGPSVLTDIFEQAEPSHWADLHTDPQKVEDAAALYRQVSEIEREMEERFEHIHLSRLRDQVPIEKMTRKSQAESLPDETRDEFLSSQNVLRQAQQNTQSDYESQRHSLRQVRDEAVRHLAEEATQPQSRKEMIADMSDQEKATHFKADIHKALDESQTARTQARRLFAQERSNLIDAAKNQGSQNPERDVGIAHAKTLQKIDRDEHKKIHAVFEEYGWERGQTQVSFNESEDHRKVDRAMLKEMVEHEALRQQMDNGKAEDQSEDRGNGQEIDRDRER